MKILRFLILFFAAAIGLCGMATKSFGQCEIKYKHKIIHATQGQQKGQIEIIFEPTGILPECQIFTYAGNTPSLITEVARKSDTAKAKVTFYDLAPGKYTVRIGRKGCKPLFIGEHTQIIIGTNQER